MFIKCISTGSKGNCYLLTNDREETLILDCGIKFDRIVTNELFPSVDKVVGCLCTHSHIDHNKSLKDIEKLGIRTIYYNNISIKTYELGNYIIYPFKVKHNVDCYGFLIKDNISKKTIAYVTDMNELPIVKNVDIWLVECNYTEELMEENIKKYRNNDDKNYFICEKAKLNHMSLTKLYMYFSNILLKKPFMILICHTSSSNCDKIIVEKTMKLKCKDTFIVKDGDIFNL